MKELLIDTNIYTHALKGSPDVVSVLQGATQIGISAISLGELLAGFKGGKKRKQNLEELEAFLDSSRVQIYSVDENTAEHYSEIYDQLKKAGTPIPTNDLWIAAIAFQHGLKMFTKDNHFKKIPGLLMVP